jgi:signal transduction histidine kinase
VSSMVPRRSRPMSRPAPFTAVRRRLMAWNIGVLCAILLAVAAGVYFSQSRVVAAEVDAQLRNQAQRGLIEGHAIEDLSESRAGSTPRAGATPAVPEETAEPYEASESPNLFSLVIDPSGHVVHATQDVQALGLPDVAAVQSVLSGRQPFTLVTLETVTKSGDQHFRLYTVPVVENGRTVGALQVGTSLAPRYAELRDFLLILAIVGGAGILLAAAGGFFLAERALIPVQAAFERQRAFVADASHELRTPLSTMRAEAELLVRMLTRASHTKSPAVVARANTDASGYLSDAHPSHGHLATADAAESAEMARDLMSEVDYMAHLIQALLQLARLDSGTEKWARELVAVDALVSDTCRATSPLAAERGLRLSCTLAASADAPGSDEADIPPAGNNGRSTGNAGHPSGSAPMLVWADPDRLRQVLLIFLDNAMRYTTPPGEVSVTCERGRASGEYPDSIIVRVTDTGPGIPSEHLAHLFDRFYRVDKARSRDMGGSGLGLAIADGIARALGGTITVESTVGVGSSFQLILPSATDQPSHERVPPAGPS